MSLSIIELIVYGLFAYSSMLVLITSINKEQPTGKNPAVIRTIFLIPGIICAAILASSGENISTITVVTSNIIKNLNNTETFLETTTQTQSITLINEVWIIVHLMIMLVLIVYVIQQLVDLLIKHKK